MSLKFFHLEIAARHTEQASRLEPLRHVRVVPEEPAQEPEDQRRLLPSKLRSLLEFGQVFSKDIVGMNDLMDMT